MSPNEFRITPPEWAKRPVRIKVVYDDLISEHTTTAVEGKSLIEGMLAEISLGNRAIKSFELSLVDKETED